MNKPTFAMKGINPEMLLTMQKVKSTPNGFGYAVSQQIQFNVNIEAPPGNAIFVSPGNDGVIDIALTSQHAIEDAWPVFPVSADHFSGPRLDVATLISNDRKSVTFSVRTGDSGKLVFTTEFVLQFTPARKEGEISEYQ